jgi:cytochrome c-type protein NapC
LSDEGHRYRPRPRPWYRSPWVATFVVTGFIVVVAVILALPVWAANTPEYCSSCKATEAAGESWATSSHSGVECVDCHVPPGFTDSVAWRGREWLNVWADYLNVPQVTESGSRPSSDNCIACHPLDEIPEQGDEIVMPHQLHVDLRNLICADCHDQVAHAREDRTDGVSMATCSMCHDEAGTVGDCSFCHRTPPPDDVHPQDYLRTHGQEALADEAACLRCHHDKASFCEDCHSRPTADHFAATWRYTHGEKVRDDGSGCGGCHTEEEFCNQCHRVNHPRDWEQTHGGVAEGSAGACLVCHPQGMCDACHAYRGVD